MMFRRECSKETEGDEIDFLPLLLLLLFVYRRFCALEELRARYMSRDDLDMKLHRSGEKKTVEKKKESFPPPPSHNNLVNEKKEKKDAKIYFFITDRFLCHFWSTSTTTFNY